MSLHKLLFCNPTICNDIHGVCSRLLSDPSECVAKVLVYFSQSKIITIKNNMKNHIRQEQHNK